MLHCYPKSAYIIQHTVNWHVPCYMCVLTNGVYAFIYSFLLGILMHIVCVCMWGCKGRNNM